jgi:hypothetical protein
MAGSRSHALGEDAMERIELREPRSIFSPDFCACAPDSGPSNGAHCALVRCQIGTSVTCSVLVAAFGQAADPSRISADRRSRATFRPPVGSAAAASAPSATARRARRTARSCRERPQHADDRSRSSRASHQRASTGKNSSTSRSQPCAAQWVPGGQDAGVPFREGFWFERLDRDPDDRSPGWRRRADHRARRDRRSRGADGVSPRARPRR